MANLTVQTIRRAGITPTYVAASAGGDTFLPNQDTFLHVANADASATFVSVFTFGLVAGDIGIDSVVASVPAGGQRMLGPFPAQHFAAPADGLADITYTSATSLSVAAIQVKQP